MSKSKIFHIAFNKSGSASLTKAMIILGLKSLRYMHEGKRLIDIVKENKERNNKLMKGLEIFDFYSDFSGHLFLQELDEQYPGSKFIITIRDLNEWLKSRVRHIKRNQKNPDYKYGFLKIDKAEWKRERKNVLSKVNSYFDSRQEDLLIINICGGEGWKKLCDFLKLPIPDQPFPAENITPKNYRIKSFFKKKLKS